MDKIYKDDIGTKFIVTTGIDLTAATELKILIQEPDLTTTFWTAILEGAAVLGKISYTTVSGDLSQAGHYIGHARVKTLTKTYTGQIFDFMVYELYDEVY